MRTSKDLILLGRRQRVARALVRGAAYAAAVVATAMSAVLVKEHRVRTGLPPALAAVEFLGTRAHGAMVQPVAEQVEAEVAAPVEVVEVAVELDGEALAPVEAVEAAPVDPLLLDPSVRWFNGRPVKPAKVIWMTVTAYSPDERSCGPFADGKTATLHSVWTNAFKLVAADPKLLPYGSMLTVPGYDADRIVPVLDCGGKIKGRRLDVLFPTHEEARKWGVRKVPVTVWKYVDGKPADNPRKLR